MIAVRDTAAMAIDLTPDARVLGFTAIMSGAHVHSLRPAAGRPRDHDAANCCASGGGQPQAPVARPLARGLADRVVARAPRVCRALRPQPAEPVGARSRLPADQRGDVLGRCGPRGKERDRDRQHLSRAARCVAGAARRTDGQRVRGRAGQRQLLLHRQRHQAGRSRLPRRPAHTRRHELFIAGVFRDARHSSGGGS